MAQPGPAGANATSCSSWGYRVSKNGTFRPMSLSPVPVSSSAASSWGPTCPWILGNMPPFICVFPNDLPTQINEGLVHVGSSSCTGLEIRCVPLSRCCKCFWTGNCSVFLQIGFVANENHRHIVVFFDASNLFSQLGQFVK